MNLAGKLRQAGIALQIVFCLAFVCAARAHDPGLSTATVKLFPEKLEAMLTFALKDAGQIGSLDTDNDGQISLEEFDAGKTNLAKIVAGAFEVRFNDEISQAAAFRSELDENNNAEIFLTVPGKKFTRLAIRSKVIALCPPNHKQYFMLQNPAGVMLAERLLRADSDTVTIEVDAEPDAPTRTNAPVATGSGLGVPPSGGSVTRPPEGGTPNPDSSTADESHTASFVEFVKLGVEHIGTGYDHLLFLFALLVVTRSFRSALAVITAFTIAHSITLAVATFNLLELPAKYTEPLIALTIVYVGVENLVRRGDPHKRWMLTFAFGLIHGFGFASVLREMGVGARAGGVAMPLFSFNLGVELGQIAVAAIALPIIWQLRKREKFVRYGVPACSVIVALAGVVWFVQRVWPG